MLRENTQLLTLTLVPVLFTLFYIVPGAVLISNSLAKEKRLENIAFAILLSLVFAPLTMTLLARVVPGNDSLLMAGYVSFWALAIIGIRFFPTTVNAWLPDFSALPKVDKTALLVSAVLTVIVVSLRLSVFLGHDFPIGDDRNHLSKLTSIAATGLPSLYARQPFYAFAYYDLDYIAPGLWVRYTEGTIGIALAWVIHIGIQTFVISLFLTRLVYVFAGTLKARLFGLLALHSATGLDLFFLPSLLKRLELFPGDPHLESWPYDLNWFDGFIQISMPISQFLWVPQHVMGVAVTGLIFWIAIARPLTSIPRAVAISLLLVALFRVSIFVFAGAISGLALWYLSELLTNKGRIRQLFCLATAALIALILVLPYLADTLSRQSYLDFGLRSFLFLDVPLIPWLKYPTTILVFLFLEIGMLLPLLFSILLRPSQIVRSIRFWLCIAVGLLIPLAVRSAYFNDIAMRGVLPAQLGATVIGCYVLTQWEQKRSQLVAVLVAIQCVLSVATASTEVYFRFQTENKEIPVTSLWVANNTPPTSLIFYEHPATLSSSARKLEVVSGQRMSFVRNPHVDDNLFVTAPSIAWRCLPEVDLYDANSLCSIEAHIPGAQPVFVRYLSPAPSLDTNLFTTVYESESGSIFSLSCPKHDDPDTTESPIWITGPFHQLRALLAEVPPDHSIVASSHKLSAWLQSESYSQRLFGIVPEPDAALNALSQSGFLRTVMPEQEGATLASQIHLHSQLDAVDASSSPRMDFA